MTTLVAIKRLRTIPQMTRRCIRYSSSSTLQDKLRHLMVHCAQPVAIVTTRLRQQHDPQGQMDERGQLKDEIDNVHEFHGATISSFSSIAMHPYPLVAFSLQLPSRLANALHAYIPSDVHVEANGTTAISTRPPAHFVINVLSTTQKDAAHRFSRPDLYPHPLAGMGENRMKLTMEDQPMLVDSVGCISCAVVHSLRLDGPTVLGEEKFPGHSKDGEHKEQWISDGAKSREGKQMGIWEELRKAHRPTSELFIARVIRVETLHPPTAGIEESRMPLVYFRKGYTTAAPLGAGGAIGTS